MYLVEILFLLGRNFRQIMNFKDDEGCQMLNKKTDVRMAQVLY